MKGEGGFEVVVKKRQGLDSAGEGLREIEMANSFEHLKER